jgi:hypothetical protein
MSYLYETHLHTCQGSTCGVSFGHDYIKRYIDLGYTGIIVTDHFYGSGSYTPDRGLPWKEQMKEYRAGYEDARNEGARRGLDVFFGMEQTFDGDDYLIYGLSPEWLEAHPETRGWTRKRQYEDVSAAGGCVIQAHPFRQRSYIHTITLSPDFVDGVEIANAGNEDDSCDAFALRYAEKLAALRPAVRARTCGSDIHSVRDAKPELTFGVFLERRMTSVADYVRAVKENAIAGLRYRDGRCDWHGGERLSLPLEILDENEQVAETDIDAFLEG